MYNVSLLIASEVLFSTNTGHLTQSWLAGKDWGQEEKGVGDRGWDGWMSSLTQWTWVWVNSRKWWKTGTPGVLQSVGSQRVGHDLATEQQQSFLIALKVIFSTKWMRYLGKKKVKGKKRLLISVLFTLRNHNLCYHPTWQPPATYGHLLFNYH